MKAAGTVILFPLMSVIAVGLYVHGGVSRLAALALFAASVIGVLLGLVWRRTRRPGS